MGVKLATLHPTEQEGYFRNRGQIDLTEYRAFLATLREGDAAVAETNGEKPRSVKRRLTMAAKHEGKRLQYSTHAPEGRLVFRVRAPREHPTRS